MNVYRKLEQHAKYVPTGLTSFAKRLIAYPRFYSQLNAGKKGFSQHSNRYGQKVLFVAGLPKSGTTWVERMLASFPGFAEVMIPEAVTYEQKRGESHTFNLPANVFKKFNGCLAVFKVHAHGSQHNFDLLKQNNIKFLVTFRDLRDVAVSHVFYVKRTTYHPQHTVYKNLDIKQSLELFAKTLLPEYVQWVNSWSRFAGDPLCYMLRYEDLRADTFKFVKEVTGHFSMSVSEKEIQQVIDNNSFEKLSGGKVQGENNTGNFFRKGVQGDWKNHFDESLIDLYNTQLSGFNAQYGYD